MLIDQQSSRPADVVEPMEKLNIITSQKTTSASKTEYSIFCVGKILLLYLKKDLSTLNILGILIDSSDIMWFGSRDPTEQNL